MGTINYGSNKYFNIGVNPDKWSEWDIEWLHDDARDLIYTYTCDFKYFRVTLEPGYYEGFYVKINFDYCYVEYWEKPLILKEVTRLKKLLLELSRIGLVKYSAGWCMGYCSEEETNKAIKEAIKEIKENMQKFPVYKTYHDEWKRQHA